MTFFEHKIDVQQQKQLMKQSDVFQQYNMSEQNNIIKNQQNSQNNQFKISSPSTLQLQAFQIRQTTSYVNDNTFTHIQQSFTTPKQNIRYQILSPEGSRVQENKLIELNQSSHKINMFKKQMTHIEQNSDQNQSMDKVNSLKFRSQNQDSCKFSVTPDHFTVNRVEKVRDNQQYSSVKSDNFAFKETQKQIYFKPVEIQLPIQPNSQPNSLQQIDGIIPCIFKSLVQQKIHLRQEVSEVKQTKQTKQQKQQKTQSKILPTESKIQQSQKNKIITDMLLTKITELQNKVKQLQQQKKKNQQIIKASSQYNSTPQVPTYGSIKRNSNDIAKKFSTVTQTQDTNNNSNFRVRSVVNKVLAGQQYKLQSNIYSLTLNQGKNQNNNIKEQLNYLKKKLQMIENTHTFNDPSLKNNIKQQNKKILRSNHQAILSPNRKQLGGKIVRRTNSNSKLQNNSPDISYRTQTQQSLYQDIQKGFVRTGPQHFQRNDSSKVYNQRQSNIFANDAQNSKKRIDSSAIFRKNPGPAIIQKNNKFDIQAQLPSKSHTLQFNPDRQKFIVMDSRETESLVLNKNDQFSSTLQNNISEIFIPELQPYPTPQSNSQELIQIGKMTFKKLGCQVSESTILNVKRFKNCVLFSISVEESILWHYQGRFFYGGWKVFANGQGQKNGKGLQYVPGKYKYKGQFKNGKRSGFGKMIGENKTIYLGYWSEGFKHGKGRLIQSDGTQYQGDWKFGKKQGFGKNFYNGKLQFQGNFQGGYKNGFGKQYFENGDYYEGNYLNGKFEGKGSYQWASKAIYIGQFKDGRRNGHGVWRSGQSDYDTYQGEYLEDNKNGYGVYKWANGAIYRGSFKNDLKHGQGCITYQNGKSVNMVWNKGNVQKGLSSSQRIQSSLQKKNHNSTMTPKPSFKKSVGTRSSNNLQSAKSLKSDRSLPKGISLKREKDHHHHSNHSQQKVQFRTKNHSDFVRLKMNNDANINRQLGQKQTLQTGSGPLKDPPYKSMQTSSNVNMNV